MKVIAMYLPQFHRVKENDEWWGEGFTDWISSRQAVPLFDGHSQPHIPLNENYYDLMEKKTMQWQADLMQEYGIDGMCMYHYWFKDGRQILEKPAENLLQWKDINMPFCFCWANETWARSWSNVKEKNVWTDTLEKEEQKNKEGVLLQQEYGREEQWKKHFEYLLPFFQDERYIKVDDKPVFLIYRTSDIYCAQEMISYWRELAKEYGLNGIYVIGAQLDDYVNKGLDAGLFHQPLKSFSNFVNANDPSLVRLNYDKMWDVILRFQGRGKVYYGGFVSYDDTPRRGMNGYIVEGMKTEKFTKYLTKLMAKNAASNNEITFLNAWNEWGEGMYLEPDTENEYNLLEAVKIAKEHYKEFITEFESLPALEQEINIESVIVNEKKANHYLNLFDHWLGKKQEKKRIEDWLMKHKINEFAMYGYGIMGKHLLAEIQGSSVRLEYIIDRNRKSIPMEILIYSPEDKFPECETVIVTATYYYDEIYRKLKEKGISKIISLEQVIREC